MPAEGTDKFCDAVAVCKCDDFAGERCRQRLQGRKSRDEEWLR
jgi:hypothetical protein